MEINDDIFIDDLRVPEIDENFENEYFEQLNEIYESKKEGEKNDQL